MRTSSIYPGGPERASGDPLTDSAEVREARRILRRNISDLPPFAAALGLAAILHGAFAGPEQFDSHDEYMAERDRELWGDAPFEED